MGKRICKTVLVNSGVLVVNYACACKTAVQVFHILFRISLSNGKNENPKEISQHDLSLEIRSRISRSIANPKSAF